MKTLSVLLTLALFIAANALAAHLRRVNASPPNPTTTHSAFQNNHHHP
jgi:hypothetical protein